MRYLFSTGLVAAISAGISLLRGTRNEPITWRSLLSWVSWGITMALAVGAVVDMRRERHGVPVDADSPQSVKKSKKAQRLQFRSQKALADAQGHAQDKRS
ncbi:MULTISPECIES: hypothetical protein [Micrococcales]|jgi:hypothetical protein|uniref:Uncharacterized protein n=2 Tax=Microbacterium TaxID=33882 RepID=A0A1H1LFL1_9MICO|nr:MULTISPECIES: hypothetical protein [Micrococcales]MBN6189973.1 hypothetical protein [Aneurinibacillus sp. BA2021]AMG84345.1 hypothetical protein AXH82_13770 [Microbacterium sp. PAMC 28756]AVL96958.1 hypothetical protein C6C15_07505 [Microbacterium sp. str. 'China']KYJ99315.1 hypothetical protein AUV07_10815 [Microbacterium sp. CH1]MBP3978207.1 hypothetical protein [Microbacterium sp. BLY]